MSISHKELMALRRAHLAEKEKHADTQAPARPVQQPGAAQHHPHPPAGRSASPGAASALDRFRGVTNKSTQPKVFAPVVTVRGQVPLVEQLRRRRLQYDGVSVENSLMQRGIDYYKDGVGGGVDESTGKTLYYKLLPLEAFDDFSFDELSPKDWMAKGLDEPTGEQLGVPCLAVRVEDGRGRWVSGKVMDWNEREHKLLVEWDDVHRRVWLPRVHVYFRAEDPAVFVERVVAAHEKRKNAEAILRYNLYVESMPVDDYQALDDAVSERIRDLSINTTNLLNNEDNLDIQTVLKELNLDYGRTMNRQLFDQVTKNSAMSQLFQGTPLPAAKKPTPVRKFGQVQIPHQSFGNVVRALHSNTYLNHQEEVVSALHRIRDENDQVLQTNIFVVSPLIDTHRPLLVEDFDELQSTSIQQRVLMLRDQWCGNIREHIKDSLARTNQHDEVNLNVRTKDEYEGTKMQRLMMTVKIQMQDTLYHLVTASLESYVRFVETCCNFSVTIHDLADVSIGKGALTIASIKMGHDKRPDKSTGVQFPLAPLFKLSLKEQEGQVVYNTNPAEFSKVVVAIFDKAISTSSEIPQIESQVMEFIYSPQIPTIQAIGMHDPLVDAWRERLQHAVAHAVKPLVDYLETYKPFLDLVAIDVPSYVKKFDESTSKIKDCEKEVQKHLDRQQEVLKAMPTSVNIGTFTVDTADFRRRMSDKCQVLAHRVLDVLARRARQKAEELEDKFSSIRSILIRPVETPEDCVKVREYAKTIPEQVFDLQVVINEMREVDDVLDKYQCALSDDDFTKKWRAIGWPSRLEEEVIRKNQDLDQVKRSLIDNMEKHQENFTKDVDKIQKTITGFYKRTDIKKVTEIANEVRGVMAEIQKLREQANTFNTHEGLFDKDKTDYQYVHQLARDFEPYSTLWITADEWIQWHHGWTNDPFETIDAEEMEKNVTNAFKNMQKCVREPKFKDKAPILKIAEDIKNQIDEFKPVIPTVKCLRQAGMKDRHWNQMSKELGFEVRPGVTLLTLQDVYSLDLMLHEQVITRISEVGSREFQIETTLANMKRDWEDMRLKVKPYKTTGCCVIPKDTIDDTQEKLDDQTLNTQALSFSPFKKIFEKDIEEWEANIKLVQGVLDEWLIVQKAWLYLEPIFQSEDIARQLPAENKRFQQVNKNFKFLTNKAHEIDLTMQFCLTTEKCLDLFKESSDLLDKVQKGLNQYLENKRSSFARFYFLSDDELLTILSEAKDPQKIQPHFRKLFENIFKIEMKSPDNEMFGMYSQMDEYIPFKETVFPRKNVENWLTEIEVMMKRSIRVALQDGVEKSKTMSKTDFILNACGQVAIAVNQVFWTQECEDNLRKYGSLEKYVSTANSNLMLLVETVRQKLTHLQRMNLGGMITIEVHARDIVEKLAAEKISDIYAFEWVSQLRSYWEDDDCFLRQVEAQFRYGGEYLGNTTRLVITPLTDRIYLTLTGAMHMFLGSAPAGPAGTGKTETVKDLAKAVAKQCVVFNCQEGMTYASMGKFFKGLANAGAWACFDEFNRIDVEVLSVVAQQVSTLQEAARSKQYRIPFEGTEIVVDPSYSVFITMNPGYAGRTELPDNLKVLFRPVACMVPDYAMIAEIRLFSFGYANSRKLAQKMVATFRLSSEQLSAQDHYDFGMRAVNTVISAAGLMKRENPNEEEDILLLRALRDSNAPKFLAEDLMLFNGIISDLFPGIQVPVPDYGNFFTVLHEKAMSLQLQPTDLFLKKCVQLFEMSILRHGQMSVGPTMGGKTCATRTLQIAMTKLRLECGEERFAEVKTHILNPKSITMSQLYGGFDDATGEWKDGLIGELFRVAARDTSGARNWVIFDGPVDALWIESMNTVLDENKKLCLISGEIISMSQYMNVWFEVEDLAVASPATVSRAGMIYMEPISCVGVENFIRSWQMYKLPKTFDPYKEELQKHCETFFASLILFVQTVVVEYNPSVWPNLVASCFNIYMAFLEPYTPTRTYDVPPERLDLLKENYINFLMFSMIWSFGATGDMVSRKKFDKFFRDEVKRSGLNVNLPEGSLLHDFEFIPDERRWALWTERSPPFTTQVTAANFNDIIVPTADVARYKWLNKHLLSKSFHTLCCGPTGTGKSVIVQELLMGGMPAEFTPIFFTFSARTSANQTQDLIFSKFEVRRRASPQIWGAPINKKFVVFIDDMNMPIKEQYGAQPPIEILRQWMDYKGWYDRKTREFFHVVDIMFAAAMGPPGGGRNKVSNRFIRHFNLISFPDIDDDNMKFIFVSILDSYMKPFNEDIRSRISSVVESCIEVYNTVIKELRPTPSRPHYLFNLRDLAKVIGGFLYANHKTCASQNDLLRMWLHEQSRTFRDRLVDDNDRDWFDELLKKQLQKHFKMKWNEVVLTDRLLFVDFQNPNAETRVYEEVKDVATLVGVVERQLDEYNNQNQKKMNLVMFLDAVEHVCRIARVVKKPNGHVLLLGVGGSGRQSLARFASFLNEFETAQVEITKGYTMNMWREDIKGVLRKASFQNRQILFLVTDTQIVHEGMLEDVNNLLNSGEVPNLFVGPDVDEIMNAMKPICVAEGINLDKVNMYARFVKFCKANMHIALCMSPLGEPFRNRLRMFPALVNCCTIDWFSSWPEQALISVAKDFFVGVESVRDATLVEGCIKMCVFMHQSVEAMSAVFLEETKRHNYVTPTSYLELLATFKKVVASESSKISINKNRLINGLEKLRETEVAVADLQRTLALNQPILIEKKLSIEKMVAEMAIQAVAAEETRQEAVHEERAVAEKQQECASIEKEAQGQLAEALPELDRALESLNNLKSTQITEVAGYKAPTPGVVMTMQGICILFQLKPVMRAANPMEEKKPDYWVTAKEQLLNNPASLLQRLQNYDKDNIPERLIAAVAPLVQSEDFTPKKIAGASQACAAMCQWTHAMVKYQEVSKKVAPLRQRLAIAQADNKVYQEKLAAAQARLAEVEARLAKLQAEKTKAESDMATLEQTVKMTEIKLERAAMLIDGLAGEKKNWMRTVELLSDKEKYLTGDMLAAAGQISYLGAFTSYYRNQLLDQWKVHLKELGILHSTQISVFYTLQDPIQTRSWTLHSLPGDTLSIENAIFWSNARRWPLMIDPQTQANKWIRDTYGDQLEVVKPSNKDMIKRIEHCIRAGRPVLLENVSQDIDPSLDPLLTKQTFMQGGQEMIRISENAVPWSHDFKFFMTTKLTNPHYIPEIMVKVTLLNFFITPAGLEDQLLGVVVGQERKELELRKNDLVQKNAEMKAELADIQKTILRKLEEVKGDILDDEELIKYLDQSKVKTDEINIKVADAEVTEKEIDETREGYRPIAYHSSILYFCCATLANVDPMYQYSLQWFVQLFINGIEAAERSEDLQERLTNLKNFFTYSFYQNISRSLFEKHKLMFSFVLCVKLLQGADLLVEEEYRFVLQGPSLQVTGVKNPAPDWLTDVTWSDLLYLDSKLEAFRGFCAHISGHLEHYKKLFMSASAHREPFHGEWDKKLTLMQKMMFIRCLRADKLMESVQDFVSHNLGEKFIKPPPFDLATSFKDSSPTTPLIFVLSPGADPFEEWKKFAETQRMGKKLSDISLGQGQGPRAERLLREGMENGMWVLLQNCHLATSWMPSLERLVENFAPGIHPSFRMWLTSMPNPSFPVIILQNGVKMTNEPPKGMRANIARSLMSYPNDFLEKCKKPKEYKKLFFSMCFFHALIQERRKFGPLGWNIPYEYTSGDLNCCVVQIQMFLDKYADVPYKVILELSGQIHYGGRVTDDWDRRTIMTILEGFVNPKVMNDGYPFSSSGIYNSIPSTDQKGYLDYIETWPLNIQPEAFGLHENADITCARNETFDTLAAIVQLQGESTKKAAGAKSPDEVVAELAVTILQKIRQPFDMAAFQRRFPTKYEDSMNTVVVQEAIRFNKLVVVVRASLEAIPLAVKGLVVMSKELEEVYKAMFNNLVPTMWADKAYPSLKPLAGWVTDLVQRLQMIESWYEMGHPSAYWISGFFFPQAFLTGILQNYARRQQISIDTISYGFEWLNKVHDEIKEPPSSGCYIYGMFIEGAWIDPHTLKMAESKPKVLFESTPMLWLIPVINRPKDIPGVYRCPLYKTLRRAGTLSTTGHSTNYVLTAEIPSVEDPQHWIKRGVAMLTTLNF